MPREFLKRCPASPCHRCQELKDALEARGLPTTGLKAELVERLVAAVEGDAGATEEPTPVPAEAVANGAAAKTTVAGAEVRRLFWFISTKTVLFFEVEDLRLHLEKLWEHLQGLLKCIQSAEHVLCFHQTAAPPGDAAAATAPAAQPKLSAFEKLKARSERFGVPLLKLSEEEKRELRAQRSAHAQGRTDTLLAVGVSRLPQLLRHQSKRTQPTHLRCLAGLAGQPLGKTRQLRA
jgi:SAP domain